MYDDTRVWKGIKAFLSAHIYKGFTTIKMVALVFYGGDSLGVPPVNNKRNAKIGDPIHIEQVPRQ